MGRPPKPTAALALVGAIKRNPKRYQNRGEEPKPDLIIGDPPAHLSDEQVAAWHELIDSAADGVITRQDRAWLEYASGALVAYRMDPDCQKARAWFDKALSKLGFNPVDRTKVSKV